MANDVVLLSKTVTAAGTAEALSATSIRVAAVTIQAKSGNTGSMYVGDSTVSAATGIMIGVPVANKTPSFVRIQADDSTNLFDLAHIWIDAAVNGEGVNCMYFTR
jgi:hypothetical protein